MLGPIELGRPILLLNMLEGTSVCQSSLITSIVGPCRDNACESSSSKFLYYLQCQSEEIQPSARVNGGSNFDSLKALSNRFMSVE